MTSSRSSEARTSSWYFVGATFLLIGSVFARTLFDAHLLGNIAIGAGVLMLVAGVVVAVRERRRRDSQRHGGTDAEPTP